MDLNACIHHAWKLTYYTGQKYYMYILNSRNQLHTKVISEISNSTGVVEQKVYMYRYMEKRKRKQIKGIRIYASILKSFNCVLFKRI